MLDCRLVCPAVGVFVRCFLPSWFGLDLFTLSMYENVKVGFGGRDAEV